MDTKITDCIQAVLFTSSEGSAPFPVDFVYDPQDPYAIMLRFRQPNDEPQVWHMSVELFTEAFETNTPQGDGDVKVLPKHRPGRLCLELSSPEGEAMVMFGFRQTRRYFGRIRGAIPAQRTNGCLFDPDAAEAELQAIVRGY
jgi:hypothetical protein